METTTVARLRAVLVDDFPSYDVVLRRLRQAGMVPTGSAGRDGVGSAKLSVRQTALLLIALAAPVAPIDAPDAAQHIASFKLLRHDETHSGEPPRRTPF